MKQKFLLKTMLLLCALVGGVSSTWADTKTEGFEAATTSTTYNSTQTITTEKSDCGIAWSIYYGSPSTTSAISGSKSCLIRYYTADAKLGYAKTTTGIQGLTNVTFNAKVTNTGNKMGVWYSTDGENWTALATDVTLTTSSASKSYDIPNSSSSTTYYVKIGISTGSSTNKKDLIFDDVVFTYTPEGGTPTCNTPTFTPAAGTYLGTQNVTLSSTTDGATIYYTMGENPADPTTESNLYSGAISVSASTNIKAIAVKAGNNNSSVATAAYTIVNLDHAGTQADPYSVADARKAIDAGTGVTGVYVSGIVCEGGSSLSSGALNYWISDDGSETDKFEIYKGKGLNDANFTSVNDIRVNDAVVVYGNIKKYGNTYEFDSGSTLISLERKPDPTFSLDITEKSLDAYTHETVDVTLTTNTDGAITCESSNDDVATVALKSAGVYTITAQSEGSATITIKSESTENYCPASATVAITVTDTRTDPGFSFADASLNANYGTDFAGQELTNPNNIVVTYSSTDETVATVDPATGDVTMVKPGTTTIKATFDGDATYKAAVASFTLTIKKGSTGLSYAESTYEIALNDESFVAPTLINPHNLPVTYSSSNESVAVVDENTGELVYDASAVGTADITASFATDDYYYAGSAKYTIKIVDPTVKGSKFNPYTVAEVREVSTSTTINDVYVEGYIIGYVNSTYGYTNSSGSFQNSNWCIADSKDESNVDNTAPVQIANANQPTYGLLNHKDLVGAKILIRGDITKYFNVSGVKSPDRINVWKEVTLNASGYATFACSNALDFTDDSEFSAWQITGVSGNAITFEQITGAVDRLTGVFLMGTAGASINIPVVASGTDISGTNKLEGITAAKAVEADTYYGLKANKFVKVNAGTVPAGKALLPASVVESAGVRELTFDFGGETNGVAEVRSQMDEVRGSVYNLNGQKVVKPGKGMYIMNGRKVIVK